MVLVCSLAFTSGCGPVGFYVRLGRSLLSRFTSSSTPIHNYEFSEAFICSNGTDGNDLLFVNYMGTNNADENETQISFSLDMSAALNGAPLESGYPMYSNPYVISDDTTVAPDEQKLLQAVFELPSEYSTGDLHLTCSSYTEDYKKKLDVMDETIKIEELERKGSVSQYSAAIEGAVLTDDGEGNNLLIVDYIFTNNSQEAASFLGSLDTKAFQNGVELSSAYLPYNHPLSDDEKEGNGYKDIQPGVSIEFRQIYQLSDNVSNVDVKIVDSYSFDSASVLEKSIALTDASATADTIKAGSADTSSKFSFRVDAAVIGINENYTAPAVFLVGEFTNNSDESMSFSSVVDAKAQQGGYSLSSSYITGASTFNYNDIEPGTTIPVIIGYELFDLDTDVTITATDSTHYANEVLFTQTYTINELINNTRYFADQYGIIDEELGEDF